MRPTGFPSVSVKAYQIMIISGLHNEILCTCGNKNISWYVPYVYYLHILKKKFAQTIMGGFLERCEARKFMAMSSQSMMRSTISLTSFGIK